MYLSVATRHHKPTDNNLHSSTFLTTFLRTHIFSPTCATCLAHMFHLPLFYTVFLWFPIFLYLNQTPPTPTPRPRGKKSKSMFIFLKFRFYNFTTRHRHRRVFEAFSKTTANSTTEHKRGKSEPATKKRILQQQYSN